MPSRHIHHHSLAILAIGFWFRHYHSHVLSLCSFSPLFGTFLFIPPYLSISLLFSLIVDIYLLAFAYPALVPATHCMIYHRLMLTLFMTQVTTLCII